MTAIYTRAEVEQLIADERLTHDQMLYLSPDARFAMYTAAEASNAHVEAFVLSPSGATEVPYSVASSVLEGGPVNLYNVEDSDHMGFEAVGGGGGFYDYERGGMLAVLQNAPGGPVAFLVVEGMTPPAVAIVGVRPGSEAPGLLLPSSWVDGFTSDEAYALIGRPSPGPSRPGPLTSFPLPGGPESAALSTSSYGWTPLGGSAILFTDRVTQSASDLRIADVAHGTRSTLVASQASSYVVSPDLTRVAYTYDDGEEHAGILVRALPVPP